jgi:DNA-binding NarL/FixJ family response regulator
VGVRVLVVEDAAPVRARVVALLREAGLEIVGEAATATEALELLSSLHPDAVVLDLQLADGNGMDILRALKTHVPSPLVAVLTNSAQAEYRARCLSLGADYFFDKSRDFDAVAGALVRHPA